MALIRLTPAEEDLSSVATRQIAQMVIIKLFYSKTALIRLTPAEEDSSFIILK